jgi:hypothetical protein
MSADDTQEPEKIDFDRAELAGAPSEAADTAPEVACDLCKRPVGAEYWQCLGKVLCASCREVFARTAADSKRAATFGRAALLAGVVALGCGIGYAVFVGVGERHFALVTIGIGWAIGRSIQRITRGFGSRKHQVLAVILTYFASSMGYLPAVFKGIQSMAHHAQDTSGVGAPVGHDDPSHDGSLDTPTQPPAPAAPGNDAPPKRGAGASVAIVSVFVVGLMLAAPFLEISGGSGFSGVLGLLILFFGMQTAWRVSKGVDAVITGPYRVAKPT